MNKAERELAKRQAEADAYTAQCALQLELAFYQVPEPYRSELQRCAVLAVIDCYNRCEMEKGDGIMAMLPDAVSRRLLDWYFDEDQPSDIPAELLAE